MQMTNRMIPARDLAERWAISVRTLTRRTRDEALGVPPAIIINGRRFWRLEDIEAWESALVEQRSAQEQAGAGRAA
jgi:hypothetical protein